MTSINNNKFKIAQWNARGLTKSRLEEFKHFLGYFTPSVVLLSETHWKDSFNVQFSSYNIFKKNRHDRRGDGVAILVHKSIKFFPLHLNTALHSIESIAISISTSTFPTLDLISAYAPNGDSRPEEILSLFYRQNPFIIGGDFNAHHDMWETYTNANWGGLSIWNALMDSSDVALLTPPDFGTRVDPSTGKPSTIDLTFSSTVISLSAELRLGPTLGSDHLPILINVDDSPILTSGRPMRWIFKEDKWEEWNKQIETRLSESNFTNNNDPKSLYLTFYDTIIEASNDHFHKSSTTLISQKEIRRPWWNKHCYAVIHRARKTYREWRDSPLSIEKKRDMAESRSYQEKTYKSSQTCLVEIPPN